MSLPSIEHPVWRQLVTGEKTCEFEFLAIQIFLGRAHMVLSMEDTPENVLSLSRELRGIFEENINHPVIVRDMTKLR